eukprot:1316634-Amorphochlora_amoeboformis.AAC.1
MVDAKLDAAEVRLDVLVMMAAGEGVGVDVFVCDVFVGVMVMVVLGSGALELLDHDECCTNRDST